MAPKTDRDTLERGLLGAEVIGIIPAAGSARRLAGRFLGSKEVIPLPPHGQPVCAHLLGAMMQAGIDRAVWIVRRGKEDIRRTLGDGGGFDAPRLEYVEIESSASVPETLSHGLRHVGDAPVALGFPDVVAEPRSALGDVVVRFAEGVVDVALGLFPTDRPDKADLVRLDAQGGLLDVLHKPGAGTGLHFTWLLAVWGPRFSRRLLRYVAAGEGPTGREPQVSDVLRAGLADGLTFATVAFPEGSHLDIGTPEDLELAERRATS